MVYSLLIFLDSLSLSPTVSVVTMLLSIITLNSIYTVSYTCLSFGFTLLFSWLISGRVWLGPGDTRAAQVSRVSYCIITLLFVYIRMCCRYRWMIFL